MLPCLWHGLVSVSQMYIWAIPDVPSHPSSCIENLEIAIFWLTITVLNYTQAFLGHHRSRAHPYSATGCHLASTIGFQNLAHVMHCLLSTASLNACTESALTNRLQRSHPRPSRIPGKCCRVGVTPDLTLRISPFSQFGSALWP